MNTKSVSSAAADAEVLRLLSDIVRAGYRIQIAPLQNDWGGPTGEAELTFSRQVPEPALPSARALAEDVAALSRGEAPAAPIHYKVKLGDPASLLKALARMHRLLVRPVAV